MGEGHRNEAETGRPLDAANPTSILAATGLDGVASLAEVVEREDLAIIDEAA